MVQIHEPMTLATDYALGALCAFLAFRMLRDGPRTSRTHWSRAFAACAAAAFAGGTYHGFLPWMDARVATSLWKATMFSIGWAAFSATVATAKAHLPVQWQGPVRTVAGLKLGAYVVAIFVADAFLIAIIDYSLAFGFVLAMHARAWVRCADSAARWVVGGVAVSFLAAGIQAAGIAPHPQFNHNDLYHVVQMAGMWLLYRGARRSVSAAR